MIYRLGALSLDTDRVELTGAGGTIALEPKAYDLLHFLLERRDRVVSKEEVIEAVWDGRFISDTAVSTVLKSLRKALGDDSESQRLVRTIRGRGFRFVGSTIIYAHMQATGMVNDHLVGCFRHKQCKALAKKQ